MKLNFSQIYTQQCMNGLKFKVNMFTLQDTSESVPQECVGTPFLIQWLVLSLVGFVIVLQLLIAAALGSRSVLAARIFHGSKKLFGRTLAGFSNALFIFMSALYPLVSKTVLKLLECFPSDDWPGRLELRSAPGTIRLVMNETVLGNASSLGNSTATYDTIVVPAFCWSDAHASMGPFAVIMLLCYTLGYPALTFVLVRRVLRDDSPSIELRQRWNHFVSADYEVSLLLAYRAI